MKAEQEFDEIVKAAVNGVLEILEERQFKGKKLKVGEAMKYLGIKSRNTLYGYIEENGLPCTRNESGYRLFELDDLKAIKADRNAFA